MSEFVLRFNTENTAFTENDTSELEIARILREVARKVELGAVEGRCMDSNGNKVGEWEVTA